MTDDAARKQIAMWLLACCALLFVMVVVGGVTRLTHSGLSIVEWKPVVGALPPLDQEQWQDAFSKYQQTPEYDKVNRGMTLEAFKSIFWWEYGHRLLGRGIGVVFFLPFLYFLMRGKIDRPLAFKLGGVFLLGGLQGAMGWYMVKSGLVDDPRVSQYRLTAHLGLALLIYAAMFWVALDLLFPVRAAQRAEAIDRLLKFSLWLAALIFVMALSGGMVAGIRAGLAYNTFPLMNGHWVPPEIMMLEPWYLNFFNNMAMVQFNHRLIAWMLAILVPFFWLRARRLPLNAAAQWACDALLITLVLQISLGIATLLLVVPVTLAAAHQGGALLLFTAALLASHRLR